MINCKHTVSFPCEIYPEEFDVVVIGGGTAGAFAGISAADCGKRVLIAERSYMLGGSATLAQVTPLMSNRLHWKVNSYLSLKLKERMMANKSAFHPEGWFSGGFSPVMLQAELEKLAAESGVKLLYGADFIGPERENGRITGVYINTINGVRLIKGTTFVDATGDALVAWRAGCPCREGAEEDGKNQPASLRFAVEGVDQMELKAFLNQIGHPVPMDAPCVEMAALIKRDHTPLAKMIKEAIHNGELEEGDAEYFQTFASPCYGGLIYFNCPEARHDLNTIDADAVTAIVLKCRQAAVRIHRFMKKHMEGFEHSSISSFAAMPGIREGRRIEGAFVLSERDFSNRLRADDAVAQTAYPVDVHGRIDDDLGVRPMAPGEYMEVPYRCMIPQGVENLLVAGRCISTTFVVQSSVRIQLVCRALGEAAGIASAMSCDSGVPVSQVSGAAVREKMIAMGATFQDR